MDSNITRQLENLKEVILIIINEQLEEKTEQDLKNDINYNLKNIENILSQLDEEEYKKVYKTVLLEIINKLRKELISLCQKLSFEININGLEYLDCLMDKDFIPINRLEFVIDLCKAKLDSLDETMEEEEEEDIIYIFADTAIGDLKNIPNEYAPSFKDIYERMFLSIYDGQPKRKKTLHDSSYENSIEHRGNMGTRMYENRLRKINRKVSKKLEELERELGASIHFVYKFEIKKCTSEDGLDKRRIERYKQEKNRMIETIMKLTAQEIKDLAKKKNDSVNNVISEKIKERKRDETEKKPAIHIINKYLHTDYDPRIFEGFKDPNISETGISDENTEEYEKYRIYKRIIMYLESLELTQLQKLSYIFDIHSELNIEDMTENISSNIKTKLIEKEKIRIISEMMYILRDLELKELREAEIEITMLLDYEEEYMISQGKKEEKYV